MAIIGFIFRIIFGLVFLGVLVTVAIQAGMFSGDVEERRVVDEVTTELYEDIPHDGEESTSLVVLDNEQRREGISERVGEVVDGVLHRAGKALQEITEEEEPEVLLADEVELVVPDESIDINTVENEQKRLQARASRIPEREPAVSDTEYADRLLDEVEEELVPTPTPGPVVPPRPREF